VFEIFTSVISGFAVTLMLEQNTIKMFDGSKFDSPLVEGKKEEAGGIVRRQYLKS
jgi:hypothetical protein